VANANLRRQPTKSGTSATSERKLTPNAKVGQNIKAGQQMKAGTKLSPSSATKRTKN